MTYNYIIQSKIDLTNTLHSVAIDYKIKYKIYHNPAQEHMYICAPRTHSLLGRYLSYATCLKLLKMS